jgi:hypothetical protein
MPYVHQRTGRPMRMRALGPPWFYKPPYAGAHGMGQANVLNPGGVVTASDPATIAFQKWICTNFPGTPGCSDFMASVQASAPPTLAPGSVSPGPPVGYNPSTGVVTDNTTGATAVNPFSAVIPSTDTTPAASPSCGDGTFSGWLCCNLGIGCGAGQGTPTWLWAVGGTLIGVMLLNAFAGRR